MKNLKKFLDKHITIVLLFLFLSIVPLYVIYCSQKLEKDTLKAISDFFIAIAAIISVVFLYLAFRESQRGNLIEMGKQIFETYKEEIESLENKLQNNNEYVTAFTIENVTYKINPNKMRGIYMNLKMVFSALTNQSHYKEYYYMMEKKDDSLLENGEILLRKLIDEFVRIDTLFVLYYSNVYEFRKIYEGILLFKDHLTEQQIIILINKLDENLRDYNKFCDDKNVRQGLFKTEVILKTSRPRFDENGKIAGYSSYREYRDFGGDTFTYHHNKTKEIKQKLIKNT